MAKKINSYRHEIGYNQHTSRFTDKSCGRIKIGPHNIILTRTRVSLQRWLTWKDYWIELSLTQTYSPGSP